jgi:hypothetical protein
MVTHSSTSRPVQCLCMAERTGCPVFTDLWSYVLIRLLMAVMIIINSVSDTSKEAHFALRFWAFLWLTPFHHIHDFFVPKLLSNTHLGAPASHLCCLPLRLVGAPMESPFAITTCTEPSASLIFSNVTFRSLDRGKRRSHYSNYPVSEKYRNLTPYFGRHSRITAVLIDVS